MVSISQNSWKSTIYFHDFSRQNLWQSILGWIPMGFPWFSIGFSTFSHGFSTSAFPGFPGFQGPSRLQIQQGNPARWMCQARAHPQLVRQLNDFLHAHHLPCRQRKALMGNGHFESRISIKKREREIYIYIQHIYIYIDTHNTYYTYYHIYYNICFSSITTGVENYW